jgi:ABC-2 type transport system ATP-binding protein
VNPGEIFGFLGPNGSGKTTTIKLMLGLLRIDKGAIYICGHNVSTDFESAMANIGGIIENPEMYSYLTGRQNLMQYLRMYESIPLSRIDEVVELVGLSGRIDDKISKYSLGMRQRLGVAQALLNHPRLLVLDEPTNGLDPAGIRDLRDILKKLSHEEGTAVFVSSHLLAEIELMCDKVGVVDHGMLIGIHSMEEMHRSAVAGTTTCEISVLDTAAAVRILTEAGITHNVTGQKLQLTLPDENLPGVIKLLASGDAGITSVIPVHRTLEDAFLEMTRGYSAPGGAVK